MPALYPVLRRPRADLVEKHEHHGGVEVEEGNGGWLTGRPQSEKDIMLREAFRTN
jgi:hypothetical protein